MLPQIRHRRRQREPALPGRSGPSVWDRGMGVPLMRPTGVSPVSPSPSDSLHEERGEHGPDARATSRVKCGGDARGVGPFHQSRRREIYDARFAGLIEAGLAYPAFETPEELGAVARGEEDDVGRRVRPRLHALAEPTVKTLAAKGQRARQRGRTPVCRPRSGTAIAVQGQRHAGAHGRPDAPAPPGPVEDGALALELRQSLGQLVPFHGRG